MEQGGSDHRHTDPDDLGGDPACWAHLFEEPDQDGTDAGDDPGSPDAEGPRLAI